MSEEFYWVIYSDEDGGHCQKFTKEELEKALNVDEECWLHGFFHSLPKNEWGNGEQTEMAYWPGDKNGCRSHILLIKGYIVTPKETTTVTEWTL